MKRSSRLLVGSDHKIPRCSQSLTEPTRDTHFKMNQFPMEVSVTWYHYSNTDLSPVPQRVEHQRKSSYLEHEPSSPGADRYLPGNTCWWFLLELCCASPCYSGDTYCVQNPQVLFSGLLCILCDIVHLKTRICMVEWWHRRTQGVEDKKKTVQKLASV